MSRILKNAVLAAWFGVASPALADGHLAAIEPPVPTAVLLTPELPRFTSVPVPSEKSQDPIADIVARQANISSFGTACGPSMIVNVAQDAMLAVRVLAPCLPYEAVRLAYEDLAFTIAMPMTGELHFLLPALAENAVLKAILSDGTVLKASTSVPDMQNFARVALQWSGADPGELIAIAPKILSSDMVQLGQPIDVDGAVLQVFSSRISDQTASGVIRLSLRAPVTAINCNTGQTARVRRAVPREPVLTYDLILKGSGCGAIGQSLELKNVLQDLKLARN